MVNGDNNQNALPRNPEGDVADREAQRLITLRNHEDPSDGALDSVEIEGLERLARLGIADRSSGLEKTLVICSSAHAVYGPSRITAIDFLPAVYVLCYLRIRAHIQGNNPSNEEIISLMCGEIMFPRLPDTHYSNAADSLRIIKTAIDMSIDLTITHCTKKISDYNAEYPHAAVGFDFNTAQNYNQCLIYLANHVLPTSEYILGTNHILYLHLAIIKRGTVSEDFLEKVANVINDELGISVTLTSDAIKRIYNSYGEYITSTNAVQICQHLSNMIPTQTLRIKLTIQQSSGLTTYMTIGKAIRLYGDFNWDKIAIILATDFSAYLGAVRIIGSNFYYGYNKDLSQIASAKYKSLGYVAKELLIKVNGEGALARYAGWTRNPKSKSLLDVMIREYINNRDQLAGQDVAPVSDVLLAIKAAIITHAEIFN